MKPAALAVVLGAIALAVSAAAPAYAQSKSSLPPAPPPPGMNDPGVKATQPARPATAPGATKPSAATAGAPGQAADSPQITECKKDDNTIQEYRRSGALYQVVVKPKVGPEQVYLVDAKGNYSQVSQSGPREPVKPVMYKVLEWGKSRPAEGEPSCGQ